MFMIPSLCYGKHSTKQFRGDKNGLSHEFTILIFWFVDSIRNLALFWWPFTQNWCVVMHDNTQDLQAVGLSFHNVWLLVLVIVCSVSYIIISPLEVLLLSLKSCQWYKVFNNSQSYELFRYFTMQNFAKENTYRLFHLNMSARADKESLWPTSTPDSSFIILWPKPDIQFQF
jgi:hypothetical protein